MRKVIISVAPVSGANKNPAPGPIAADVTACRAAGAAMVHLHARDLQGRLTEDVTNLSDTLDAIRAGSDIVIQASTGGVSGLNIRQRCMPLTLDKVETASLNVGSVNLEQLVYQNPIEDVKHCVRELLATRILPEIEVFELGMIHTVMELDKELHLQQPILINLVLGHQGAMPATSQALHAMYDFLPKGVLWGVTHFGRTDGAIFREALDMGASLVRIGFEDSNHLENGETAETNAPLVAYLAKMIRGAGCEPATPAETRALLHTR